MMSRFIFCLLIIFSFSCKTQSNVPSKTVGNNTAIHNSLTTEKKNGFLNFTYDEKAGTIFLEIDKFNQEILYVNSLPAGVGSNDIGLDRGQLGGEQIIKFVRVGQKVLMIQPNYNFRAISDNPAESESVEQAFAQSVLWGFKVKNDLGKTVIVDATDFLLRDAHGVADRLQQRKQGSYKIDKSRSAIYPPMCKNFPKNTELEATITFTGKPTGSLTEDVVPNPKAITVRMHHSFIELPDDNYEPRVLDPRCGFFGITYHDYATPIDQPIVKRFIKRHRLEKKDPSAAVSEAVEPIIYYVDKGAPEPVLSALIEGASWWNQAFEAAGYRNAFQVKKMPDHIDPMDVRYNIIQWVHRSTRGWSYGSSVSDPRTGEILKGHVSLGSLRVRQDFLIAQGLIKAYEEGKPVSPQMLEMALARLRQLSAHEVGHTIGLAHNFAASTNDRASVMDYPHPYITLNEDGSLNFENAYDDKIGAWDKRTILYGYQDFPEGTDEEKALLEIINENRKMGLQYISDADARPPGGAHPYAHLWDNGVNPMTELERLMGVRAVALKKFSEENISMSTPMSQLEEVLVPLFLAHRYQVEGAIKMIGGVEYEYSKRGDTPTPSRIVPYELQMKGIPTLMKTLKSESLAIPKNVLKIIPPKAFSYQRGRESFKTRTGLTLDPVAAAESMANHIISLLLHPHRATRLVNQNSLDRRNPGLHIVVNALLQNTWYTNDEDPYHAEIGRAVEKLVLQHLMKLAMSEDASETARAVSWLKIDELERWILKNQSGVQDVEKAHYFHSLMMIENFKKNPQEWKNVLPKRMPDGSPIGMDACGGHF